MTGAEWLIQCEKHARLTGSMDSFISCVIRIQKLGRSTGYKWHIPIAQNKPTQIEFEAGGFYGGLVYHEAENKWSVHT